MLMNVFIHQDLISRDRQQRREMMKGIRESKWRKGAGE